MLFVLRKRDVLFFGLGAVGAVGAAGVMVLSAGGAAAVAPTQGKSCSPKNAVYQTETVNLLCAQAKNDSKYRWRDMALAGKRGPTGPAGPVGPPGEACATGTQLPFVYPYPQAEPTGLVTAMVCVVASSTPTTPPSSTSITTPPPPPSTTTKPGTTTTTPPPPPPPVDPPPSTTTAPPSTTTPPPPPVDPPPPA